MFVPLGGGEDPTNGVYLLTQPLKYGDQVFYQALDTMTYEPDSPTAGHLVTHSPPFIGLLLRRIQAMQIERFNLQPMPIRVASTSGAGV